MSSPPSQPAPPPSDELESLRQVAIAFPIIITIAVGLRFFTRQIYARLAVDDWLMLGAWAVFIVNCALGPVLVNILEESTAQLPAAFAHVLRAKAATWVLCLMFLKLSLCFYFLKIFIVELFRFQRYLIISVILIYELYSFVYFIYTCTSCGLLVLTPQEAKMCSQINSYHIMSLSWSVFNILSDFFLCALAAFAVHNARINLSAHISAYLVLALGTLGGIASILRLVFTSGAGLTLTKTAIWAIVEAGCGILAGSLATLRPLLRATVRFVRPGHTTSNSLGGGSSSFGNGNRFPSGRSGGRRSLGKGGEGLIITPGALGGRGISTRSLSRKIKEGYRKTSESSEDIHLAFGPGGDTHEATAVQGMTEDRLKVPSPAIVSRTGGVADTTCDPPRPGPCDSGQQFHHLDDKALEAGGNDKRLSFITSAVPKD